MVPESGHIILPKYQLSLASGHIIVQEHLIGPSKRAYYFTTTYNLFQQAGILFFPNSQLAPASGNIIFPQLSIGSCKRVHYFSPNINRPQQVGILFFLNSWLKQAGTLFFPNYQMAQASGHIIFPQLPNGSSKRAYYFPQLSIGSSKRAYYFSPFNSFQQAGIFSQNIKLAPGSRHIFPNHQLPPASVHIIFPQLSIGPSKRPYFFTTLNWIQQTGILHWTTNF